MTETPFKLLVIDDDEDDLQIFCEAVDRIGPPVTCHASPKCIAAVEMLLSKTVAADMIFLDAYMNNMDGIECLRFLKEHPALSQIPVVMMAGIRNERLNEQAMQLGALNYIQKPGDIKQMVKLIKSVLPFHV